ncbi:MAG: HAD family phosphatase [Candidatus Binatia bacterium]|jgi:HAD superfamily hydrolase (TIGR01509 family)|nr:HAD family phosphatase [Candidatus Binatia bacterium]
MLRAVVFDFNGVIVNDEPIHLEMYQKVLLEQGISLETESYYANYLGLDDRGCFKAVYRNLGRNLNESGLREMIDRKARYYRESIEKRLVPFAGVETLIANLSSHLPLAIASGALRDEIELALAKIGIRSYFQAIVSAEDVREAKPDPEIFRKALSLLNQRSPRESIEPSECLVIEDSKEGIHGAHRAGMKCLAISNSHPAEELEKADAVINSLVGIDVGFLERLFSSGVKGR